MALIILNILGFYLLAGFIFSILFVLFGIGMIDTSVKGSTIGFRIVVIPGATIFWPFLLLRWIKKSKPPIEKSLHRGIPSRQ